MKSTVDEIRARFDADVERFSDLSVAQATAIDSKLCLELIADGAAAASPNATAILDVGCGAGNWTLTLLQRLPGLSCTLVDLSQPMLDRAQQRVSAAGSPAVATVQGDVRELEFLPESFDLIVAGAVLHHLRDDAEWDAVFAKFHRWLRPGGSVWVYDYIEQESPVIQQVMRRRYADFLNGVGGPGHAAKVFGYADQEDTPRPVTWQMDRLRMAGFSAIDLLHKHLAFAAYVAFK
ncbi:MAG: class SAM-dependent methyltransferase [Phycisphaerales bacterium]|nr:class SAM-dependent methyltransferase [Phycisphaerales bacterium]